jgi:hypothetical protein
MEYTGRQMNILIMRVLFKPHAINLSKPAYWGPADSQPVGLIQHSLKKSAMAMQFRTVSILILQSQVANLNAYDNDSSP